VDPDTGTKRFETFAGFETQGFGSDPGPALEMEEMECNINYANINKNHIKRSNNILFNIALYSTSNRKGVRARTGTATAAIQKDSIQDFLPFL
jgi:hypothetical protein